MRRPLLIAFLFLTGSAQVWGQDRPDYFPLGLGNTWVYMGSGSRASQSLTLQIMQMTQINNRTYALLHGLPGKDYWLRKEGDSILAYDPDQNRESLWYVFGSANGVIYETNLPEACCGKAVVVSTATTYKGPVGEFQDALEINYPGTFQVGIENELFLPNIGLVHRAQATGGPSFATYDLIYARVGTRVISAAELAFSLSLDRSVYVAVGPGLQLTPVQLRARITVRNTSIPVQLTFPTTQIYDLLITNEKGEAVYRWSADKTFLTSLTTVTFGPGETNYVIETPPLVSGRSPLPPGKYVAEAWLTLGEIGGRKMYSASVAFEVH
jgi:hypothetical protein